MAFTSAEAKEKLEAAVQRNLEGSRAVINRVMTIVPKDSIVRGGAMGFTFDGKKRCVNAGDVEWTLHDHALNQIAGRADVPSQYINDLVGGQHAWQQQLAGHVLRETYSHALLNKRFLVRAIDGEMRGFLSDRFRRLDSRPILEAFVHEAQQFGAVPYSGHASDLKVGMKALLPMVHTLTTGEHVALGIEWSNSDYGTGANSWRQFILRLRCINGATGEDVEREVHLGRRMTETIEFSERTMALDTRTVVSATRDVVRSVFAPNRIAGYLDSLNHKASEKMTSEQFRARVSRDLTKDELRRAVEVFEGPDVENLPEGNTAWRASNALSWIAKTAEGDRVLDLERAAGKLLVVK